MTSPSSSAPASAWSVNQVKKLSGSSCCLFLPALFCVWLERLVRSYQEPEKALMIHRLHKINANIGFKNLSESSFTEVFRDRRGGSKLDNDQIPSNFKMPPLLFCFADKSDHTFPDFHLISVDFEDGSPLSFKWNSLESTLLSKYGFSSKYYKIKMYFGKKGMGNKWPQIPQKVLTKSIL